MPKHLAQSIPAKLTQRTVISTVAFSTVASGGSALLSGEHRPASRIDGTAMGYPTLSAGKAQMSPARVSGSQLKRRLRLGSNSETMPLQAQLVFVEKKNRSRLSLQDLKAMTAVGADE